MNGALEIDAARHSYTMQLLQLFASILYITAFEICVVAVEGSYHFSTCIAPWRMH